MHICNKRFEYIYAVCNLFCFAEELRFEGLGCFNENDPRALPILVKNLRPDLDWWHLDKTVKACAEIVKEKGNFFTCLVISVY